MSMAAVIRSRPLSVLFYVVVAAVAAAAQASNNNNVTSDEEYWSERGALSQPHHLRQRPRGGNEPLQRGRAEGDDAACPSEVQRLVHGDEPHRPVLALPR